MNEARASKQASDPRIREGIIVIENIAFPCPAKSDAKDPKHRHEEDLHINGPQMLEDARINWPRVKVQGNYQAMLDRHRVTSWQSFMMFMLPRVADYYNVGRHALLKAWMQDYGYDLAFPAKVST